MNRTLRATAKSIIVEELKFQRLAVNVLYAEGSRFGGLVKAQFEVGGFYYELNVSGEEITLDIIDEEDLVNAPEEDEEPETEETTV